MLTLKSLPILFAAILFGVHIHHKEYVESTISTPASTSFIINDTDNQAANGSVTVTYEGEQVTTHYTTSMDAFQVANAISGHINLDADIQLSATVPQNGVVLVKEKRNGSEYNGNTVWVSHTNNTHITVNGDMFFMSGGTD